MNEQHIIRVHIEDDETLDVAINRLLDMPNLSPYGLPRQSVGFIESFNILNAYAAYVLVRLMPAMAMVAESKKAKRKTSTSPRRSVRG